MVSDLSRLQLEHTEDAFVRDETYIHFDKCPNFELLTYVISVFENINYAYQKVVEPFVCDKLFLIIIFLIQNVMFKNIRNVLNLR